MLKSLQDCIELSNKAVDVVEHEADITFEVDGNQWRAYTAAISNREFLLYCPQGVAAFVVDAYGSRLTCELVDWTPDGEE
jgi:hypothetical protein